MTDARSSAADEAGRFADIISKIAHELRSPLTSVQGFSATLTKRWDRFSDAQRREFVETIHTDAERMSRIISEVLDLARLETGRLELNLSSVNVLAVAEKAVGAHRTLPGADRVAVEVADDLNVRADPDRLAHMVGNLIENAIKFSDDGPIRVTAVPGAETVAISVADEGVGIEAERLEHIFSGPGPTGQKATPSGTGLGLYLGKRLAEAHRGTISVESSVGKGSKFTIELPREAPDG